MRYLRCLLPIHLNIVFYCMCLCYYFMWSIMRKNNPVKCKERPQRLLFGCLQLYETESIVVRTFCFELNVTCQVYLCKFPFLVQACLLAVPTILGCFQRRVRWHLAMACTLLTCLPALITSQVASQPTYITYRLDYFRGWIMCDASLFHNKVFEVKCIILYKPYQKLKDHTFLYHSGTRLNHCRRHVTLC